ncbi:MAG TPA: hypothetical protein VFQ53_12465 [Kofleriaceae bacterium]|nr:hypothetical protein [Kofleriaceae bacterium]
MLFAAALAGGCYGSEVQYRGGVAVTASTPDLVYVQPGVGVIADYDEPIFYADNYYWWFYNGAWYRSNYYTGGWVYVSSPSVRIARIGNPYYYRHYRPHNYVVRHRPVPVHRIQRPVVRDHRATRERYYRR